MGLLPVVSIVRGSCTGSAQTTLIPSVAISQMESSAPNVADAQPGKELESSLNVGRVVPAGGSIDVPWSLRARLSKGHYLCFHARSNRESRRDGLGRRHDLGQDLLQTRLLRTPLTGLSTSSIQGRATRRSRSSRRSPRLAI